MAQKNKLQDLATEKILVNIFVRNKQNIGYHQADLLKQTHTLFITTSYKKMNKKSKSMSKFPTVS